MVWYHRLPPPAPKFFLSHHERHCRGWAAISPQSGWVPVIPYPRPAATEEVYLIAPQEFNHVFMHYTHVTAIENTSSNAASWCQPVSPCKGIPLSLFQVAYDLGEGCGELVHVEIRSTWRRPNERNYVLSVSGNFLLLSTEQLEGWWKVGRVVVYN